MTFLFTLLTFFVDGKPNVPVPATAGAITVKGEFAEDESVSSPFNRPRLTPLTWHNSPSWMVASPPVRPVPFDVFAPAVRPPQDFPGLVPCSPVTLVACPAPSEEPPAIRHVSYSDDSEEETKSSKPTTCQAACPFAKNCPDSSTVGKSQWKKMHARQHAPSHPAPRYSDPASHNHAPKFHPPHQRHKAANFQPDCRGAIFPARSPDSLPVIFWDHEKDCRGSIFPARSTAVAASPYSSFPGAKKVKHVVSATYDVPQQTAEALEPILEKGEGVLGCLVEGDEMTVTAHPPAQSTIARFLQMMASKPKTTSRPAKLHDVKDVKKTNSKCCNGQCGCQGQCQCDCQCCGKKKKEDQADKHNPTAKVWFKNHLMSQKARAIAHHLGIQSVTSNETDSTCSKTPECPSDNCCPATQKIQAVVHCQAPQSQPVTVKIRATSDGVQVWTSDGKKLQAKEIELETNSVRKVKMGDGMGIFKQPKPATSPDKETANPLPTY